MKKFIILLAGLFIFMGCMPVPESETTPSNTKVTIEDTSASPDPENVFISDIINQDQAVTSAITEDTDQYEINVQFPKFDGQTELNEIIKNSAINEVDTFKNQIADISIEDMDTTGARSYLETYYSIERKDSKIISVHFENQEYSAGAAHPMTYSTTINWDVQNNKEIQWIDVIPGDYDIPAIISEMVKPKLYTALEVEEGSIDDWIEEGAGPKAENFGHFTINNEGITIYFDPYQVAAYAVGPLSVNLSFEDLGILVNQDLIPANES